MKTTLNHIVLRVQSQPSKPFSIRIKNSNSWLCANTANPKNWHYANNQGCTGVTEYSTLEDAIKIDELVEEPLIDLEILQMRGTIAECEITVLGTVYNTRLNEKYNVNVRLCL